MSSLTTIEWTEHTWNPIRGCVKVSPGCKNCYAETFAERWRGIPGHPYEQGFDLRLVPEKLDEPLHWKKPSRIFVNSMSDLFQDGVPVEFIDKVFAVMALARQHTFQILTKRPERMRAYVTDLQTPFRVAKAVDALRVQQTMTAIEARVRPIPEFPGYFVSNTGTIFSGVGSAVCVQCGADLSNKPRSRFCGPKCRSLEHWRRKHGKQVERENTEKMVPMSPEPGDQGHLRITLRKDGKPVRVLVHRVVLTVFDREPLSEEQACHQDGNPLNNHIANLRWGTQADNWDDRRRHGNSHSYGERRTVPSPIEWPLSNCWKGVSVENQAAADERIPLLLQMPAAVRFLSIEPLLEYVDLLPTYALPPPDPQLPKIDWIIIGGESGPGARPCSLDWIRSIVAQCKAAGVACFVKQLGAEVVPFPGERPIHLRDRKGGDPAQWPEDLRVREYPT